mmetsp:Transcript_12363/g.29618  ORF Transcript_12363/g.29618 Transcript_12363/m.29618 type:complete len:332 (+) Transcript_12363:118-1113(+)
MPTPRLPAAFPFFLSSGSLGEVHMGELLSVVTRIVLNHVSVAGAVVAVGHEPLEADGAAGRHHARRDSHLSAEAVAEAVSEARRRVPVHASSVDVRLEERSGRSVLSHDAVGVPRAKGVDVRHRLVHVAHHLDGEDLVAVLGGPVLLGRRLDARQNLGGGRAALEVDALLGRALSEGGEELIGDRLVHEERLERVARRGVLDLGVDGKFPGHVEIRLLVNEHVADSVRVTQHSDVCVVHNVLHELVGPARDDQVNVVLHLEHLGRLLARSQQRHHIRRRLGACEAVLDGLDDGRAALHCLAPALEQHAVAGLDSKGRDLNGRIRAGLKDDA